MFAKKTDDGYLQRLDSAEKFQRRRRFLINKKEIGENTEDKIFDIMESGKLTHRQKMDRIAEVKKQAMKKVQAEKKKEGSVTHVEVVRQENIRKFNKEFNIKPPLKLHDLPKPLSNAKLKKKVLKIEKELGEAWDLTPAQKKKEDAYAKKIMEE